ncbi:MULTISPECIES: DUF4159 domain-containing protein [unclassified Haematobacter]|uniref:DUF4159 domain-containing protein n=1 Tax=unclassified Haematobacter TaxID=2640585 RepID=UPI0025BFB88A|nr:MULTISPECIES: DUF4159 domain-containing protein [unclassified Haematobacter]
MWMIGPVGFTAPLLLAALVVLPVLWLLLRAVPPAPIRRRFPGVALLLGLKDEETVADKTPWWLLLLRAAAVALLILGFAGPVLNPAPQRPESGPLLILADGTWADAGDWQRRVERMDALLSEAARAGRPVAVVALADLPKAGAAPDFLAAEAWRARLPSVQPRPWEPDPEAVRAFIDRLPREAMESYWLSDGMARESREPLLSALQSRGTVTVYEPPHLVYGLKPPVYRDGMIALQAIRLPGGPATTVDIAAFGRDPAGIERELVRGSAGFDASATEAGTELSLPPELRNRITRFEVPGQRSAAAVSLTDDALKRRKVAIVAARSDREGLALLSPSHFLREALQPTADLMEGPLEDMLLASPDVIIMPDIARVSEEESARLVAWMEEGGLLLRFAGPALAASDVSRTAEDPLLPVRLREGGRSIGGAMSWGEPKTLRAFAPGSPFYGLPIPSDVNITAQVMAQPDPQLSERTIASLSDGTPLVTRKAVGQGQVVLFHVTANAEWSSLPLSGLFVQMLERLSVSAGMGMGGAAGDLAGTTWVPEEVIDAFGRVNRAGALPGIAGEVLANSPPGPATPPGLYAGDDRRIARNVIGPEAMLTLATWPAGVRVEGLVAETERDLKGGVLTIGLLLLLVDLLLSLWLAGRLGGGVRRRFGTAAVLIVAVFLTAPDARAQEQSASGDDFAMAATAEVVLAYVQTGDAAVDRVSRAGLQGLSQRLFERTSVEPGQPIGVDLERDELAFFPFLYWPITADERLPSDHAYANLNRYLRSGGLILFDTRDADMASAGGGQTPEGRRLALIAAPLDIPPLEKLPADHVLTRTFYLLQDFPGRFNSHDIWVEAAPPDAEQVEGMPFRNLNDGVTPVVIGGNDWASAWAVSDNGMPLMAIGRGTSGERQREIAARFGINLIMHVLTGNYKSDQVHVPALLDRLGQ